MFYKTKKFKIAIIILAVLCILTFFLIQIFNKKSENEIASNIPIFTIDKIVLYSSASAITKDTTYQKAYWNLDIYQYTDIAVYINNKNINSENTPENTIKTLFIDNINYSKLPQSGTPSLYYKEYSDFGLDKISENNVIKNDLEFEIYSSGETDYSKPAFYSDCSNPITLGFINKNIAVDYNLLYSGEPITFDGNILEKANISLSSISTTVSFNVNIVNNLDEAFTCNVIIPINLKTDTESIYSGNITETQMTNFKFEKI